MQDERRRFADEPALAISVHQIGPWLVGVPASRRRGMRRHRAVARRSTRSSMRAPGAGRSKSLKEAMRSTWSAASSRRAIRARSLAR
jgi:hypothetical protein